MAGKNKDIRGIVIHGNHLGRVLGFPTANISIDPLQDHLENVASLCEVFFEGNTYPAMGTYLPFKHSYEVHLLDWEGDLYDKEIQITILETIRENRKFETQEALKQQIQLDREYAKNRRMLRKFIQNRKQEPQEDDEETDEIIGI
ncbi:MAG: Riboflavin biosynthesis protein RibF [Candidatus Parcubacteria bacterium]|jgi:riboflavin kinase/FMN adenylyltransferase